MGDVNFLNHNKTDWLHFNGIDYNEAFDQKIKDYFFKDYQKAINNKYDEWQNHAKECLALIIMLDQFSRNLFRNNSKAFAMDTKARLITNEAINRAYIAE